MLQQGVHLLERLCRTAASRFSRPRSQQQIQFTRTLKSGNSFVAYIDAIGELDDTACVLEWKTVLRPISGRAAGDNQHSTPS